MGASSGNPQLENLNGGHLDVEFGVALPAGSTGLIATGLDGATTPRALLTAADGTLRIDPSGTTPQPVVGTGTAGTPAGGVLSTQTVDRAGTGTIAAPNTSVIVNTQGASTVSFSLTGTWTAVLALEGSSDGIIFYSIIGVVVGQEDEFIDGFKATPGLWQVPCGGYAQVRVRTVAWTSGTINVAYNVATGIFAVQAHNFDSSALLTQVEGRNTVGTTTTHNPVVSGIIDGSGFVQNTAGDANGNQYVKVTDGTNFLPTMDIAARAGSIKVTDGTRTAIVKASSTAAAAVDAALVVAPSPNTIGPVKCSEHREEVLTNLNISGDGAQAFNTDFGDCHEVTLIVESRNAPTGSPSVIFTVNNVDPNISTLFGSGTSTGAVTGNIIPITVLHIPAGSRMQLNWAFTGTGSLKGVYVTVVGHITPETQLISALSLPLPTDAATETSLVAQSLVDNALFTNGTTRVVPAGYILDETAGAALTENDAGAARMDDKRAQVHVIEDTTTRGRRATIKAASTAAVAADTALVVAVSPNNGLALDATLTAQTVVDNAAFTDGTTRVQPAGYIFDEVAGTALTENDAAAARVDSKRAQVHVLEDATTRGTRATIKAASTAAVAADTAFVVAVSPNNGLALDATLSAQSLVDNAPFTDGTTRVVPAGFVFDETAGGALTENDAGAARVDGKRAQIIALEDATTRGQRLAISAAGAAKVENVGGARPTYSASAGPFTAAAAATDIFTLTGSATKTIRVTRVEVAGTQTTGGITNCFLVKRSTANTGGTSAAATVVPHASTDAAGTATAASYTANPTLGTTVGTVRNSKLSLPGLTGSPQQLVWEFGDMRGTKPATLVGVAQQLSVNMNGATMAGNSFDINIEWYEE